MAVPGQLDARRPDASGEPAVTGTWWLLTGPDDTGAAEADFCAEALRRHGGTVVPLGLDADRTDRAALAARLRDLADGGPRPAGIVSLLPLDETPAPAHQSVPVGFAGTVTLVQALGDAGVRAPLWCLTRGAVATGPADPLPHPLQQLTWGFGRVAALEHPDRWGGLVDLPDELDDAAGRRLVRVLAGADGEDQVALRWAGAFGRRLLHAPLGDTPAPRAWRPSGTALVTGGTGALGGHMARWLAANGAAHLVLVSRRGRQAEGIADLEAELVALGARVTVAACDAADRSALAAVLADLPSEHPLTTVVHTAAVLDDSVINSLTLDQVDYALSAKVTAALNLHELTRELDLDAFILFSSMAGTVGSSGVGTYAPATRSSTPSPSTGAPRPARHLHRLGRLGRRRHGRRRVRPDAAPPRRTRDAPAPRRRGPAPGRRARRDLPDHLEHRLGPVLRRVHRHPARPADLGDPEAQRLQATKAWPRRRRPTRPARPARSPG
ncbi:beta-ketoacyl reductase [Micromonospora sp. BRA006-A]|nr:beta-ketoacyl reductase [Micromonospora sp. BRA006-A]